MQSFIKPKRNGISANILRSECIQLRAKEFSQRRIEDMGLHGRLFPENSQIPVLVASDYDYLLKEMLKSGV